MILLHCSWLQTGGGYLCIRNLSTLIVTLLNVKTEFKWTGLPESRKCFEQWCFHSNRTDSHIVELKANISCIKRDLERVGGEWRTTATESRLVTGSTRGEQHPPSNSWMRLGLRRLAGRSLCPGTRPMWQRSASTHHSWCSPVLPVTHFVITKHASSSKLHTS